MKYRKDRYGNDISVLGFGCMRFQRSGGSIDMAEAERELMAAIDAGVNYFDTAYIYPGSEAAIGEIFAKNNVREKIYIATKLPHYLIKSREGMEKLFKEHLKRLKTDYIDYYLMHMLTDTQTWEKLKKLGILEFLEEKKNPARSVRSAFPTTAIPICSASFWMPTIGTSARFSITIWTSILRRVAEGCSMLMKRASL